MRQFSIPPLVGIASIWVVWAFLATGALGWAASVVLNTMGVKLEIKDFAKEAAAWVQAVGSIGAILVAGAIPARQRRLESLRREVDQYQKQVADCFQLRRLVQEARSLLAKAADNSPNEFGSSRALVEFGMRDILQRLSSLEAEKADKVLLKGTYDMRLILIEFLDLITPYDVCGINSRRNFDRGLGVIHNDLPPYIVSLEKIISDIEVEMA